MKENPRDAAERNAELPSRSLKLEISVNPGSQTQNLYLWGSQNFGGSKLDLSPLHRDGRLNSVQKNDWYFRRNSFTPSPRAVKAKDIYEYVVSRGAVHILLVDRILSLALLPDRY